MHGFRRSVGDAVEFVLHRRMARAVLAGAGSPGRGVPVRDAVASFVTGEGARIWAAWLVTARMPG
jgi:hypothetical protein